MNARQRQAVEDLQKLAKRLPQSYADDIQEMINTTIEMKNLHDNFYLQHTHPLSDRANAIATTAKAKCARILGYEPHTDILASHGLAENIQFRGKVVRGIIILAHDVAEMTEEVSTYNAFGKGKTIRKRVLENVIAHEIGHTHLETTPHIDIEDEEGFAFWFGDTVSGVTSPLELFAHGYNRRGIQFSKVIDTYNALVTSREQKGPRATMEDFLNNQNIKRYANIY